MTRSTVYGVRVPVYHRVRSGVPCTFRLLLHNTYTRVRESSYGNSARLCYFCVPCVPYVQPYTTDYSISGQAARKRGGALWVSDLATPNSTKALPLAAVVLLVANMQLAFAGSR